MMLRRELIVVLCALLGPLKVYAFAPVYRTRVPSILWAGTSIEEEIQGMRIAEIKSELESYGISTRSFLEKKELVAALVDAREQGLEPHEKKAATSSSSSSGSSSDERPREERLHEELENCKTLKAAELKKELQERGIDTRALLEKSELVQALAEARVDGVKKNGEGYAEYADVEVLTDDSSGPRKRSTEQQETSSNPFNGGRSPFGSGGSSPFGSGANPFGGMGGMGGMGDIADMLKNMGGGAAAGGNPFGGANPFGGGMGNMGDMMGQAQELMKNPKVMELVMKAQSNPNLMRKVQECMSNPAAMSKYANDPEVKELIDELRKSM